MKNSIIKLIAALSMVLAMVGCTVEVISYALDYDYTYVRYCDDIGCEDLSSTSYVQVEGTLDEGSVVTIYAYLPGDQYPDYEADYIYNGRKSDNFGDFYHFVSVSSAAEVFDVYDSDYAIYEANDGSWSYEFANSMSFLQKKAAAK